MTPRLKAMLVTVGIATLGGGLVFLTTPQPSTRTMLELRDAGLADGQRFVLVCPERLTQQTRRRINAAQPGALRPRQQYAQVARVAVCLRADGGAGNCFGVAGNLLAVAEGAEVVVPSLRRNLDGIDAGVAEDDGGTEETDDVDDAFQYRYDECHAVRCTEFDAGNPSPFATGFCQRFNRLMLVPPPCHLPNCYTGPDGAWDDNAVVDCQFWGPYSRDGGPQWRGCNVGQAQYSTGNACLPVSCSVVAGDPLDWL